MGVGEHRYCFNEHTFAGYHQRVVGIADHGTDAKETVILYELQPTEMNTAAPPSKAEHAPTAENA